MPIDPTHLRVLEDRIERLIEHLRSREPAAAAALAEGGWQSRPVGYRSEPGGADQVRRRACGCRAGPHSRHGAGSKPSDRHPGVA